jgi:glycosyltransferase involved in cell wall biosynthesis
LKDRRIDILHTHLFYSGLIGSFAKLLHKKTIFAMMRHHTAVVRMMGSRIHVAADKWMAEQPDHVMTVSEAARAYMFDVDGIRRDNIDVVYLGFDFDQMSPNHEDRLRVRQEFGFTDDDLVIGYVGNFAKGKGHSQLVEAFARIATNARDVKLLFVGRGMLPEVEATVANIPEGRVFFTGWRDDISACFNAMDVFVQPSLSEAFSQVLIEAMGVGLPVIATDVGGATEVIEDSVNGLLIEPDNTEAIHQAFMRLYNDREFLKGMAVAGSKSVRSRFTAQRMVERHLELYSKWLNEDPKKRG